MDNIIESAYKISEKYDGILLYNDIIITIGYNL